jgi:hypothetical protein
LEVAGFGDVAERQPLQSSMQEENTDFFRYTELPKSPLPAPRQIGLAPPQFDDVIPEASTALFPDGFRKLKKFVYPYITKISEIKQGKYPYPEGYDVVQTPSEAGGGEGGNPDLWNIYASVGVDIKNTGKVAGKEVAQLYISHEDIADDPVDYPVKVLRGFEKVFLEPGESKSVHFNLTRRDLSYWDTLQQNWVMPVRKITITVGASSRDLKLTGWY